MKTLITEEQLRQGIDRLADEITNRDRGPPADHRRRTDRQHRLSRRPDPPAGFSAAGRSWCRPAATARSTRPGPLVINLDLLSTDVRGRDVLLVDDIFDTGNTLWELVPQIDELGPASVRTAVLLRKEGRCQVSMKPDFVGFDIPDAFVVGYGLDYRDMYRNLPYVAVLEPSEVVEPSP